MEGFVIPALMPNYNRCDVALERGEGAYAFTADGTRYLDFMAGIAVNSLGHAHPRLVAALKSQGAGQHHDEVRDPSAESFLDARPFTLRVFDQVVKHGGDQHIRVRDTADRP